MLADYHLHSNFSYDSSYPMNKVVKDAIRLGLDEICFTDHVEYGPNIDHDEVREADLDKYIYGYGLNVDYPRYFRAIDKLAKKNKDKITLKKGLEFGFQRHTFDRYVDLFDKYKDDLDFVILSCHEIDNKAFWNQEFQTGLTQDEVYKRYYGDMLYFVKNFKGYNVLGHLDHISRYDYGKPYESEEVDALIDEILKTVIEDNKGIELNTSYSRRYGEGEPTPSRKILKRYKELGGEIITIGSDSHGPGQLGDNFSEAKEILKELGFEKFCTFEKMKPIFHDL